MGITLVLKHIPDDEVISFEKPEARFQKKVSELLERCRQKTNGYVCLTFDRPHKPRTTGDKSQNNLFWKLVEYIELETGGSKDEIEMGIKERAVEERNYPTHLNPISKKMIPNSMKVIDTVEMSKLIETEYDIIAELGIVLPPNIGDE